MPMNFRKSGTMAAKMPQEKPGANPQADDHDAMMAQRIRNLKAGLQRPMC